MILMYIGYERKAFTHITYTSVHLYCMYKIHRKIMGGVGAMRFSLYSSSSDICLSKLLLFGKFYFLKA